MPAMRLCHLSAAIITLVFLSLLSGFDVTHAQNIIRGVNFVHPSQFDAAEQDADLAHLKSAGVHVIRIGIEDDLDKNIAFMKRAYAQKIATVLILHGKYAPNAPVRPYRAKEFPGMWAGPPFSSLDPRAIATIFSAGDEQAGCQWNRSCWAGIRE